MRDSFAAYHPLINFVYFTLVIGFSLALTHPLAQGIALVCAAAHAVSGSGRKSGRFWLTFCLPTVLLTTLINALINHKGETALFYFIGGTPLTLESVLYGLSAGVMLMTMLVWFSSFNRVMTADKLMALFGKTIPALSLVLSMTLRFVPRFRAQMVNVAEAQRSIGRDVSRGNLRSRIRCAVDVLSMTVTWALENAVDTADSMKSRGYGLKGRTAFSVYRLTSRDVYALVWLSLCGLTLLAGGMRAVFGSQYFPTIQYTPLNGATVPFFVVYAALCITPVAINAKEEWRWRSSVSSK